MRKKAAAATSAPPRLPQRKRGAEPTYGPWLLAVGVVAASWWFFCRESAAVAPTAVEEPFDAEVDTISDKLGAVKNRLFSSDGGYAFDRSSKNASRNPDRADAERNFSDADYWDRRYEQSGGRKRYDWYGVWDGPSKITMKPHVSAFMPPVSSPVLNIGCGTSRFPEELYEDGYSNLVNIDISQVAVDRMAHDMGVRPGVSFLQMDATSMSFEDGSFAAVFEKGTLDALYTSDEALVRKTVAEAFRVLRPGGIFVSTTFGHPSSRRELNATMGEANGSGPAWASFRTICLDKETGAELASDGAANSDSIFIYIMTKAG